MRRHPCLHPPWRPRSARSVGGADRSCCPPAQQRQDDGLERAADARCMADWYHVRARLCAQAECARHLCPARGTPAPPPTPRPCPTPTSMITMLASAWSRSSFSHRSTFCRANRSGASKLQEPGRSGRAPAQPAVEHAKQPGMQHGHAVQPPWLGCTSGSAAQALHSPTHHLPRRWSAW